MVRVGGEEENSLHTGSRVLKLLVCRTLVQAGVVTPFTIKDGNVSNEELAYCRVRKDVTLQ
jgi:hypothetical protein